MFKKEEYMTETEDCVWPTKPKIFTVWSFIEKVCQPISEHGTPLRIADLKKVSFLQYFLWGWGCSKIIGKFLFIKVTVLYIGSIIVIIRGKTPDYRKEVDIFCMFSRHKFYGWIIWKLVLVIIINEGHWLLWSLF